MYFFSYFYFRSYYSMGELDRFLDTADYAKDSVDLNDFTERLSYSIALLVLLTRLLFCF